MFKITGYKRVASVLLGSATTFTLAGCGGLANPAPVKLTTAFRGSVHGGQQPISGAAVYLYAAGTTGYSSLNANLLTKTVTSDTGGHFDITGDYSCTAGQQMYIVAIGGNPGSETNANSALMAALGDCSGLTASTFISVNEVTTVGSIFALAPFMSSYSALGTSSTNTPGLALAFASINKLVDIATGSSTGPALPVGATSPSSEINTLADILATCINSAGGVAGDGTRCGTLFALTTPPANSAPTDTIQAVLRIAQNPTRNAASLYDLSSPAAPFVPQLQAAPNDWTLSINYTSGGFSVPKSTTIDGSGNVWVANTGNNTVTVLAQTGSPLIPSPLSGNGLNTPSAIAIDAGDNAWVANKGGGTVSVFTQAGGVLTGSPFNGSETINAPSSIAIDAPGNVWVGNSGNSSITELTSAGAYTQQITTGIDTPAALAIDPK
jgi:DNA-binding beta-propeller fold protein YncE